MPKPREKQFGPHRDFGERLEAALNSPRNRDKLKDLNRGQINKKMTGKTAQSLSYWINGDKLPAMEQCIAICKFLNISLDWLALGRGDMDARGISGELINIEGLPREAKQTILGIINAYESREAS